MELTRGTKGKQTSLFFIFSFLAIVAITILVFSMIEDSWMPSPSFLFGSTPESPLTEVQPLAGDKKEEEPNGAAVHCNIFDGKWVHDPDAYPLYDALKCPLLSDQVACRRNGRPDFDYERWRWEPTSPACSSAARFNATDMLERLKGKKMLIIGDSLNRNQWESMACLLYSAVKSPTRVVVNTNSDVFKSFVALDYNCTVEFFWNPFLVKMEKKKDGKRVLNLDRLPETAERWLAAAVLVFNTGHWWTHRGKMRSWDYLELKGELVEMEEHVALGEAMKTWARWVDRDVDLNRTTVYFRSISPEHKRESNHWCYNQTEPFFADGINNETNYVEWFPKSMVSVVEETIRGMSKPVKYLNITRLSEQRRDGHASVYTAKSGKLLTPDQRQRPEIFADCSHWCLPGVPDAWNTMLYADMAL